MAGEMEPGKGNESDRIEAEKLRAENVELKRQAAERSGGGFWRSFLSWVLIILTSVAMFGAVLATWIHYTALNTTRFVKTVAPLIQEPAVNKAISQEAVARLFTRFDLKARIERDLKNNLPKSLQSAANPLSSGAENLSVSLTRSILKSQAFQTAWKTILATAHSEGLSAIRSKGPVKLNEQGEVVLDLSALLNDAKDKLVSIGVTSLKNTKVPSDLGTVVLYRNAQLGNARQAVKVLDTLFWILPWVAVALLALSIAAAKRHNRAVIEVSVMIILFMVVLVVALKTVQYHYINPIHSATNRTAAMVVVSHVQGGLNRVDLGVIIVSLLAMIGAMVAGPYVWAGKFHGFISLHERRKKKLIEAGQPAPPENFFSRFAWPLRVAGFCAALLLLLYLPWADFALVAIVSACFAVYLAAIEILR